MRIVCLSDTHTEHSNIVVPDGDILIHAGDALGYGTMQELAQFQPWFGSLPHKHKIFVAGNHDWPFERTPDKAQNFLGTRIIYLQDREVTVEGLRIYGSPWQPEFCGWAFNLPRNGEALQRKWDRIPEGLDILITHGPPFGHCDAGYPGRLGCELLAETVERVRPRLHVFGHIHSGYGVKQGAHTIFVNAALCNVDGQTYNTPTVIDL